MKETLSGEVKDYFKKFIECINLEQNAESDRMVQRASQTNGRDTHLKVV